MKILTVDFNSPSAPEDFTRSLKETGFAIIDNPPVDAELLDKAHEEWGAFFKKSDDEKEPFLFDNEKHDGFVPTSLSETAKGFELRDLKEFYHYYPWGRCPDNLRELTDTLSAQLTSMAETLLSWVEANTPTEISKHFAMPLSEMIKDSHRTLFRTIHYPPLTGDEQAGAIRAAAHEDINLLTTLPTATAAGLQVKDNNGVWIDVECVPGRIIVNTGDMLHELTNGYYNATSHRVVNPVGNAAKKSRISLPLFLHPRDDIRLSARHTAESYRLERYAELGLD